MTTIIILVFLFLFLSLLLEQQQQETKKNLSINRMEWIKQWRKLKGQWNRFSSLFKTWNFFFVWKKTTWINNKDEQKIRIFCCCCLFVEKNDSARKFLNKQKTNKIFNMMTGKTFVFFFLFFFPVLKFKTTKKKSLKQTMNVT